MEVATADITGFLKKLKKDYSPEEISLIEKAYHFAEEAHRGQKRESGEPYFSHCRAVAEMLMDMHMDCMSICAALLHDMVEDTPIGVEMLRGEFPNPIPDLVLGVTKISSIQFRSAREKQAENLRQMILAMARDIRVIIIKLCDRIHNLRTLDALPLERRQRIAKESLEIYAPLANRLGMMRLRAELEDMCMRHLYPEEYRELLEKTQHRAEIREALIEKTNAILEAEIKNHGIPAQIRGRSKHLYGIFQKMRRQNISFEEIFDLNAIRIITTTVEHCYGIMGLIHTKWRPVPGRFRDFIALPKENQYQSLHTTVIGPEGEAIEIQIRTWEMHRIAEEGIAAHWKYKEGRQEPSDVDKKLLWLRQVIEWIKDIQNPEDFMEALKKDVFSDVVFCFTPAGDVIQLPRGATPLDFAYDIHTQVGNTCVGARVNKKYVSLKTSLENGDVVEIITSKSAQPSRDWVDIVKTSRARNKIKHYLRTLDFDLYVRNGHDLLQKALRLRHLSLSNESVQKQMDSILKGLRMNTHDDLFFEIGFGSILAQDVAIRFHPDEDEEAARKKKIEAEREKAREREKSRKKTRKSTGGILVDGVPDPFVRFANCCNPIAGEPIAGFITRGRGISVHKADCPSLHRLVKESGDKSRMVKVNWDQDNLPKRHVNIRVVAHDRTGLLNDVTGCIRELEMNVEELQSKINRSSHQAVFKFMLSVDDNTQLDGLLKQIQAVPGVISTSRTIRKPS